MIYSKSETLVLADEINRNKCIKELNFLISKDGCSETMPFFVNEEIVLNMDCVEGKLASEEKRSPNKSMDSAFIITNHDGNKKEILLVEFRFNYENMKNLDKYELFDKVTGSINALKKSKTKIKAKYIYIFEPNLKQQAIRRFRNMVPSMPLNYTVLDIHDLKSSYF